MKFKQTCSSFTFQFIIISLVLKHLVLNCINCAPGVREVDSFENGHSIGSVLEKAHRGRSAHTSAAVAAGSRSVATALCQRFPEHSHLSSPFFVTVVRAGTGILAVSKLSHGGLRN